MVTDGLLGVFTAGVAFNLGMSREERETEGRFESATDTMLVLPAFLLIGVQLPWPSWLELGWPAVGVVVAVLLLRRLPWVLLFQRAFSPLQDRADGLWYGWFGPIGVSAVFYAMLTARETGHEAVWIWVSLVVFASIIAHGLTAGAFTVVYGRSRQ